MSKIRDILPFGHNAPRGVSLAAMQEEINRMFEHLYNGMQARLTDWDELPAAAPAINVAENGSQFRIEAALPGMEAKDVKVETAAGVLTISGQRREEKEEKKEDKGETWLRREISYGSFLRSVPLPETADPDKAQAEFRNGILTVTIPKKAEAQQKPRKVEVKQAA